LYSISHNAIVLVSLLVGIDMAHLLNLQTMCNSESCPLLSVGNPDSQSKVIESKGFAGTGSGRMGGAG
jgi:hypothetical protein